MSPRTVLLAMAASGAFWLLSLAFRAYIGVPQ